MRGFLFSACERNRSAIRGMLTQRHVARGGGSRSTMGRPRRDSSLRQPGPAFPERTYENGRPPAAHAQCFAEGIQHVSRVPVA